jgi:hypothetical protein
MVKKSLIAIALMSFLATSTFAGDAPDNGQWKFDDDWPKDIVVTYTELEICQIPIVIDIGMFVEIENCDELAIILEQVSCPSGQSFPCYKGCVEINVRANFEVQLGLKLYKIGDIISQGGPWYAPHDNWKAYFTNDGGATQEDTWIVDDSGDWNTLDVCVEAWDANIFAAAPTPADPKLADYTAVGEVAVTVVPTAVPSI